MKKQEYLDLVDREFIDLRALIERKTNDYSGGDEDTLANFRLAEKLDLASAETGLLLRMMDKVQRVKSFLKKGELSVQNESAQDAVRDIIGYSFALIALMEEKKVQDTKVRYTMVDGKISVEPLKQHFVGGGLMSFGPVTQTESNALPVIPA